jgi:hypothetical protein
MFPPVFKQQLLVNASTASNATASAVIDTLGVDFVSVGVAFSTVANTNPEITLKLGEGDTTSSFTDITAAVGGGVGGFSLPTPPTNTSVSNTMQFNVDTRHRKRYLLLTVTPFTTKTVAAWATFGRPDVGPRAATSENLMARVEL